MLFRTKVIEVEAHHWDGDHEELLKWANNVSDGNGTSLHYTQDPIHGGQLSIQNWNGFIYVSRGNYILCDQYGQFSACHEVSFLKSHELVPAPPKPWICEYCKVPGCRGHQ